MKTRILVMALIAAITMFFAVNTSTATTENTGKQKHKITKKHQKNTKKHAVKKHGKKKVKKHHKKISDVEKKDSYTSKYFTGNAPEIKLESQNISVATQVNLMLSRNTSGTDEHTGFLAGDRGSNSSPAPEFTLSKKSGILTQQIGNPKNEKLKTNFLSRKNTFEPQYVSIKKENGETITTPRLEMSMEREISENVYVAGEGRFEKQYAKGYLGIRYKTTIFNDMLFLTGGVYAGIETNPKPMGLKASLELETPRHLMVKGEVETGGSGLWYRFKGMAKTGPLLPVDWGFYAEKDKGVGPFVQVHLEKLLKFDLNIFGTKTFGKDNMLLFGVNHTFN